MRLYSTPQSALAGEATVLAIIETIAATAFSVWLVVHRGTLTHVVIGACVAPFLLLRTDESTTLAVGWIQSLFRLGEKAVKRLVPQPPMATSDYLSIAFWSFPFFCALFLARPLAVAFAAIRRPIFAIRAIPLNWNRLILATDFYHPPELVPGIETVDSAPMVPWLRFSEEWKRALIHFRSGWQAIWGLPDYFLMAVIYAPALAYRYVLKATAVVYLPILWVLHDSLVEASSFQRKLEDIKESQIERLKRWYSIFVLLFLVVVPAIIYLTQQEWWQKITTSMQHEHPAIIALLSAFLPTASSGLEIRGWHLARGVNATLTILLFSWADGKLRQISRGRFHNTDTAIAKLNLWLLLRGVLTLYIIGCTLYIVAVTVNWKTLWPLHFRWFPWN